MTAMADYAQYNHQLPHRRPVSTATHTLTKQQQPYAQSQAPPPSSAHYHSRTASSAIFSPSAPQPAAYAEKALPSMPPTHQYSGPPQPQQHQQQQQYPPQPNRRMTNSTVSSRDSIDQRSYAPQGYPQQYPSAAAGQQALPVRASDSNLRRSTSSRSQASSLGPSSYVALLRKQKATVWCERTQAIDPRVQMQAKHARARAANEINKAAGPRTSIGGAPSITGGGMLSRNKKNNGRTQTGLGNAGANLAAGVGVPMRLSASEVGDEESDEDDRQYPGGGGGGHKRTGSGRSSLGGASTGPPGRLAAPRTNTRLSYGSSQPGGSSAGHTPPGHTPPGATGTMTSEVSVPATLEHTNSFGSAGSEERREREMGEVGDMGAPKAEVTQAKKFSKDELARRGSVDERSATMRC